MIDHRCLTMEGDFFSFIKPVLYRFGFRKSTKTLALTDTSRSLFTFSNWAFFCKAQKNHVVGEDIFTINARKQIDSRGNFLVFSSFKHIFHLIGIILGITRTFIFTNLSMLSHEWYWNSLQSQEETTQNEKVQLVLSVPPSEVQSHCLLNSNKVVFLLYSR